LSLEAAHETLILVCVVPEAASEPGVEGGVVSGHALVAAVVVALAERLPAASTASTATEYKVPQLRPLTV
jgi:hypothetical protein